MEALKMFGTYSFYYNGPGEVMDIDLIAVRIKKLDVISAIAVIKGVAESKEVGKDEARKVAACIVGQLEEWDDLFEKGGDLISKLYNES
jgi:hypothetical protein